MRIRRVLPSKLNAISSSGIASRLQSATEQRYHFATIAFNAVNLASDAVADFSVDKQAVPVEQPQPSHPSIVLSTGTFDPIHKGHVTSIEGLRHELGVDQVIVAAVQNPAHKVGRGLENTYVHRTEMVKLAVTHIDGVSVDEAPFPSTYNSFARLHVQYPYHCRIFLMGMDLLESFPVWKGGPERYLRHANVLVIHRPEYNVPDTKAVLDMLQKYGISTLEELRQAPAGRILVWSEPLENSGGVNISSTGVRRTYSTKGDHPDLDDELPKAVRTYIAQHGLYGVHAKKQHAKSAPSILSLSSPSLEESMKKELESVMFDRAFNRRKNQ